MERSLWILFGAVVLVLAIAAANVAGLLFARVEARRRELAIRAALGASSGDLVREAFAEGLVLTGGGAVLAILVGIGSTRWLKWLAPAGVPRLEYVAVDWRILALTALLALVIALVVSAIPLVQLRSGVGGVAALGEGGRSQTAGVARHRVRRVLVVTQVALALVLLVGAGLLLRSFNRLRSLDLGLDANGVLTAQWFLPYQRYDSTYKVWRFADEALAKIRTLPGVTAAGLASEVPFMDDFGCTVQGFEDSSAVRARLAETKQSTCAGQGSATPGFFGALKVPIIAGRDFTVDDNTSPKRDAVIVTKAFADRFWPGENPIGKGVNPNGSWKPPFRHVVGVTADVHGTTIDGPPAIGIWYPWSANFAVLIVRTNLDRPMTLLPALRRVVAELDPAVPLANAEPMEAIVDRSMARLTFTMLLLGIAGGVALALAAVGLYGLISYLVVRRTNEIGVRIALGASTAQVEGLVVGGALKLAIVGLAVGAVGAAVSSRVLRGLLYGVAPWDPQAYGAAIGVLALVAALAGWIPARRAARISPVDALRRE